MSRLIPSVPPLDSKEAVAIAIKNGIIYGRTTDTFVPDGNATRAEPIVMIKRLLSLI